jgi:type I restriction enzyme S subunit
MVTSTRMRMVKLKDVCDRITVGHVGSMASRYTAGGVPFLRSQNIMPFRLNLDDIKFIPTDFHQQLRKSALQPGDVAVVRTGYPGTACVIPASFSELNCADLVVITPSPQLNPYYLAAIFNSAWGASSVAGNLVGVAQQHFNIGAARELEVSLPPRPVQDRIAGILSAYDELIENSQRRIRILETMARSLYREWFVNFRFPGHEKAPRIRSALGEIPERWEVEALGTLMSDHIGGGWGKEAADEDHTESAWVIRGTDIPESRSSGVAKVPRRFHTISNLRSRKLLVGDIVFEVSGGSKGQPVGRTVLITQQLLSVFGDEPVMCASFCKRVRPNGVIYGSELLYLSFMEGYESGEIEQFQVQSTGISNFKWTEYIASVKRVIPPKPLQARFLQSVAPIFSQIGTLGLQVEKLRRTRDLLLPRLLSGQIVLSVPQKAADAMERPLTASATKPVRAVTDEFVEAVVISHLVRKLSDPTHPLGRKRYNKLAYLAHRKAEDDVTRHYVKKAAGPYSPWSKYGGPEKIAESNGYVKMTTMGIYRGFVAGKHIGNIDQYISHYPVCAAIDWVVARFRYAKNDELELMTTVDFAALDLLRSGAHATPETIREIIATNKNWAQKLTRPAFSYANIAQALQKLQTLFPGTYAVPHK